MHYSVALLTPELEAAYTEFRADLSLSHDSVLAYHHLAYREVTQASIGSEASPRYWVVFEGAAGLPGTRRIVATLPCLT
jgi:hypothetical protein